MSRGRCWEVQDDLWALLDVADRLSHQSDTDDSESESTPDAAGTPGAPEGEGGSAPAPNLTSNRRLQQTQAQVDEVVDIMRVNVDKVLERDQKLSELDDRADALQAGASQFESSAAKLKNKYWWKNCKMMIMMAVIGIICVGVVFSIIELSSLVQCTSSTELVFTVGLKWKDETNDVTTEVKSTPPPLLLPPPPLTDAFL
ncbi:vesicle-associated membrane protein 2-like [Lampris incognitus]|uniref:vesicle-associated membrane protein 2-like n=1 Tax=Lampris incognitus TaxID=2546036 RepID=UPI0024B56E60|nr:vesicle-associated membrane protein 2-like [Lampris incognitus]